MALNVSGTTKSVSSTFTALCTGNIMIPDHTVSSVRRRAIALSRIWRSREVQRPERLASIDSRKRAFLHIGQRSSARQKSSLSHVEHIGWPQSKGKSGLTTVSSKHTGHSKRAPPPCARCPSSQRLPVDADLRFMLQCRRHTHKSTGRPQ